MAEPKPVSLDVYSSYEAGLRLLLDRIGRDHPRYAEALTYQQRLLENIGQARRYGDTETRRSECAEVIDRLNELASDVLGLSFNQLCDRASSPPEIIVEHPAAVVQIQPILPPTPPSALHQLPFDIADFTGREKELAEVSSLLGRATLGEERAVVLEALLVSRSPQWPPQTKKRMQERSKRIKRRSRTATTTFTFRQAALDGYGLLDT